ARLRTPAARRGWSGRGDWRLKKARAELTKQSASFSMPSPPPTGLVPGIHVFLTIAKTWMAGHRRAEATPFFERLCPAMTPRLVTTRLGVTAPDAPSAGDWRPG